MLVLIMMQSSSSRVLTGRLSVFQRSVTCGAFEVTCTFGRTAALRCLSFQAHPRPCRILDAAKDAWPAQDIVHHSHFGTRQRTAKVS